MESKIHHAGPIDKFIDFLENRQFYWNRFLNNIIPERRERQNDEIKKLFGSMPDLHAWDDDEPIPDDPWQMVQNLVEAGYSFDLTWVPENSHYRWQAQLRKGTVYIAVDKHPMDAVRRAVEMVQESSHE